MSDSETKAKVAGGVAGVTTAASIGYTAIGVGAAKITGGLAAAGSLVGVGTMAGGLLVVSAAPLAVGALVYGAVKFFSED